MKGTEASRREVLTGIRDIGEIIAVLLIDLYALDLQEFEERFELGLGVEKPDANASTAIALAAFWRAFTLADPH